VAHAGMKCVSPVAIILATFAGMIVMNPCPGFGAEPSAMENFHFFETPPEANEMNVVTVEDRPLKLSELKGKVVLLNFWRQNCRYCQQEKQYLKDMQKALKDKEVIVLCVDMWDRPAWVKSYAKENGNGLLFAFQPSGYEAVMENVVKGRILGYFVLNEAKEAIYEVKGFPSTYVIDKEGKVVAAHLGMARWTDPNVVKWLSSLVAPTAAPFSSPDAYYELPSWIDRILLGDAVAAQTAPEGDSLRSTQ
jgi:thiol-disulfide isomerase/thioredoxin